jgi:hypothetical protein
VLIEGHFAILIGIGCCEKVSSMPISPDIFVMVSTCHYRQ